MGSYKNLMETILEELYDQIERTLDCCHCPDCRRDVLCYALNRVPPKYVVTRQGELFTKLSNATNQKDTDLVAALAMGAKMVKDHPRHA